MARSYTRPKYYSLEMIGIFAGLSANALARIQRRCSWRRYEQGEPIVNYLDPSSEVFFITAGEAHVTIYSHAGKVVSFGELGAGEVFGEYAAIDQGPRSASVEARTSCLVASMPAPAFRALLETQPTVTLAVLTQLVKRTRTVTRRVSSSAPSTSTTASRLRCCAWRPWPVAWATVRVSSQHPRMLKSPAASAPLDTHSGCDRIYH
jgi:CRP-like cAMP-binding protein